MNTLLRWLNPLALRRDVRRCLTGGSVTLLLAAIVSMNIVWGYPWVGIFAAAASMFVIGWVVNRWMRPSLNLVIDAPSWIAASCPLKIRVKLTNRRSLPAIDLRAGVLADRHVPVRTFDNAGDWQWTSDPMSESLLSHSLPFVPPRAIATLETTIRLDRRGIRKLPPVQVESLFPFHLFRHTQRLRAATTIAVAPARIDGDSDPLAGLIRARLRGLVQRWTAGDSMHYVGSREYQPGMPVRRWDFASWARLGKPILREFSTPATHDVLLVVDTSPAESLPARDGSRRLLATLHRWGREGELDAALERLLSIAAMSAEELVQRGVAVHLLVTADAMHDVTPTAHSLAEWEKFIVRCGPHGDLAEIMISLASAAATTAGVVQKVDDALAESRLSMPMIFLARRPEPTRGAGEASARVWIDTRERGGETAKVRPTMAVPA